MKAIHNRIICLFRNKLLFSILQRYKMKAIHNNVRDFINPKGTVFNTSKIQNESNSQPLNMPKWLKYYCFQYFKDTK